MCCSATVSVSPSCPLGQVAEHLCVKYNAIAVVRQEVLHCSVYCLYGVHKKGAEAPFLRLPDCLVFAALEWWRTANPLPQGHR